MPNAQVRLLFVKKSSFVMTFAAAGTKVKQERNIFLAGATNMAAGNPNCPSWTPLGGNTFPPTPPPPAAPAPPSPAPPPSPSPPPAPGAPVLTYYDSWSDSCTACPGRFYGGSQDSGCSSSCANSGGAWSGGYTSNSYVGKYPRAASSGEQGCGFLGCKLLCKCQK